MPQARESLAADNIHQVGQPQFKKLKKKKKSPKSTFYEIWHIVEEFQLLVSESPLSLSQGEYLSPAHVTFFQLEPEEHN